MRNARDLAERWRAVFRDQRSRGLSAAFCRQARVPQASFYAWRRRLHDGAVTAGGALMRRTSTKPSRNEDATFVEIKLPGNNPQAYLTPLLVNLQDTPANPLDSWLPDHWKKTQTAQAPA
jgi:hypothetical protein